MTAGFRRSARLVVLSLVVAVWMVWFWIHGPTLAQMAHRTVLDMRPFTTALAVPVDPSFRRQLVLPQEAINARPELMRHPVCVALDLVSGANASGRLVFKAMAGNDVLAVGDLAASQIVDGEDRICLGLPLEQVARPGVVLEVSAAPDPPPHDLVVVMGAPRKAAGLGREQAPELMIRLIAQAPWGPRQIVNHLMVGALVTGVLVLVLGRLWGGRQPVK